MFCIPAHSPEPNVHTQTPIHNPDDTKRPKKNTNSFSLMTRFQHGLDLLGRSQPRLLHFEALRNKCVGEVFARYLVELRFCVFGILDLPGPRRIAKGTSLWPIRNSSENRTCVFLTPNLSRFVPENREQGCLKNWRSTGRRRSHFNVSRPVSICSTTCAISLPTTI